MIDVTIVTFNNVKTIDESINSVKDSNFINQIIVIDHGNDGSDKVASDLGAQVIKNPNNPGYGTGQNYAISLCESPFILLLNPDAKIDLSGLEQGHKFLLANENTVAIQGIITNPDKTLVERSHGNAIGLIHLYGRALGLKGLLRYRLIRKVFSKNRYLKDHIHRIPTTPENTDSLGFAAALIRRSAFEKVGGFDQDFFMYGEDTDLCKRFKAVGYDLISLPVQWATHIGQYSGESNLKKELLWWEGTLLYANKWFSKTEKILLLGAQFIEFGKLSSREPKFTKTIFRTIFPKYR